MSRRFLPHPIEFRYEGKVLDEVFARGADVHLEMMNDNQYALIIDTPTHCACINIGAKNERGHVYASVFWDNPVNRRSEAQHRRWNALTPAQRRRKRS